MSQYTQVFGMSNITRAPSIGQSMEQALDSTGSDTLANAISAVENVPEAIFAPLQSPFYMGRQSNRRRVGAMNASYFGA